MKHKIEIMILSLLTTILACLLLYQLNIPNPDVLLFIVVTFFLYKYGLTGGIPSGIATLAYTVFFFNSNFDSSLHNINIDEIKNIIVAISLTILIATMGLLHKNTKTSKEKLYNMAVYDSLTGLYNRYAFLDIAKNIFSLLKRANGVLTVLVIDIDFFKQYNDIYGHLEGDKILTKVASTIKSAVKRSTDYVIRYGGDEFLVLLSNTNAKYGKLLAQSICDAIANLNIENKSYKTNMSITVSIGCYSDHPSTDENIDNYIRKADLALYKAKNSGHNCVKVFQNMHEDNGQNDGASEQSPTGLPTNYALSQKINNYWDDVKRNILIVDDDVINQKILGKILEGIYEIAYASDGLEALNYMNAHADILSVVLLDLHMPKMNGFLVLNAMKADPKLNKIPAIVLTSQTSAELQSLQEGARDFITKPYDAPEVIRARVANIVQMAENTNIVQVAERDQLTGLYTKDFFFHYCEQFDLHHAMPKDAIVIDIDHFKLANDMYGKAFCDKCLQEIAHALDALAKKYVGLSGRLEADTFMLYQLHTDSYEEHVKQINDSLLNLDRPTRMHIRIGIYQAVDDKIPVKLRFERAQIAEETVRDDFTKPYALFAASVYKNQQMEQQYISNIDRALKNHEFVLYYQPQYDVSTETPKLVSAEALIRWNSPEWGQIPPSNFIPLFERNGLIQHLDQYVWEEAARQVCDWKQRYASEFSLSVNVSRIDMFSLDLITIFQDIVKRHGILPQDMALEITESAYTSNPDVIINVVNKLRKLGFKIEMDDFGSGYSSLNMLSHLPFDVLKMDMHFFQGEQNDELRKQMTRLIIEFSRSLKVPVIAEGVENKNDVAFLKSVGCQIIQGYVFSRPLPAAEFEKLFLS